MFQTSRGRSMRFENSTVAQVTVSRQTFWKGSDGDMRMWVDRRCLKHVMIKDSDLVLPWDVTVCVNFPWLYTCSDCSYTSDIPAPELLATDWTLPPDEFIKRWSVVRSYQRTSTLVWSTGKRDALWFQLDCDKFVMTHFVFFTEMPAFLRLFALWQPLSTD